MCAYVNKGAPRREVKFRGKDRRVSYTYVASYAPRAIYALLNRGRAEYRVYFAVGKAAESGARVEMLDTRGFGASRFDNSRRAERGSIGQQEFLMPRPV